MNLTTYLASSKEQQIKILSEIPETIEDLNAILKEVEQANWNVRSVYSAIYENYTAERIQKIKDIIVRQSGKPYEYWENLATLTYEEFINKHCI